MHKKCSGVKGSLKTGSNFQCKKCRVNGTTSIGTASGKQEYLLMENDKSVEWVEAFVILGICLVLEVEQRKRHVRIRCAWKKLRELSPILTARGDRSKGKIYSAVHVYVRSSLIYGSETWPMKVKDTHKLESTEDIIGETC